MGSLSRDTLSLHLLCATVQLVPKLNYNDTIRVNTLFKINDYLATLISYFYEAITPHAGRFAVL